MTSILTKPLRLLTTKLVVALGAVMLWPTAAQAAPGVDISIRTPVLAVSSYSGQRYSNQRRSRSYGIRSRNLNRNFRNNGYYNGYRSSRYSSAPRYRGSLALGGSRSCRNVTKEGYWDGYPALIGGRECYDRYGRAYISPNSRHLIRYY